MEHEDLVQAQTEKGEPVPQPQPHAWRETWDRPVKVDENKIHPFTLARMTDHNVRGRDVGDGA
jgi:hypothetical protein